MNKLFILCLSLLLILPNSFVLAQSMKKATKEMWYESVVGNRLVGGRSIAPCNLVIEKNGFLTGYCNYKGTNNTIQGNWTFDNKNGYCNSFNMFVQAEGKFMSRNRECQSVMISGNQVTFDGNAYRILKK